MVDARGGKAGGTSGGGGGALAGYATQAWVNEGFVSIEFFNRLFTVYGPGETSSDPDVVIAPNDLDSTIKNIKAIFGLWTEQYLSALGLNPGGTGSATSLSMLDDVDITTPTNGQALVYNSTSLKWENGSGFLPLTGGTLTGNLTTDSEIRLLGDDLCLHTVPGTDDSADIVWFYSNGQEKARLWTSQGYSSPDNLGLNFRLYTSGGTLLNTGRLTTTNSFKTINGNSILGTGDIVISGGGSGGITPWPDYYYFSNTPNGYIGLGLGASDGRIMFVNYKDKSISFGTNSRYQDVVLDNQNLTVNGGLGVIGSGVRILNPSNTTAPLVIAKVLQYDNNPFGLFIKTDGLSGGTYLQAQRENNDAQVFDICLNPAGGNVGIGTSRPSYKLDVSGSIHLTSVLMVATSTSSYTVNVGGSIYATGGITALSDIKQKNIKEYMQLGIDEVANAPVIKFTWKDPEAEDKGLQVGSIAQYWEKVLPEAVKKDKEGTLSMSYGVVALVAAISTAKKVQEHERRIADLECENKKLKGQLIRLNRYGE